MINVFLIEYDFSGVRTYCDELVQSYKDRNDINVYQLFLDSKETIELTISQHNNITSIKVPSAKKHDLNRKYYFCVALLLGVYYKGRENVILHCNAPEHYDFCVSMKMIFNCQVIFTFHFLEEFLTLLDYNKLYNAKMAEYATIANVLPRMMLSVSDFSICVTEFAKRAVTLYYGIDPEKIKVIYNGISISSINIDDEKRLELKLKYGFQKEDKILLYVGPLQERKGIDQLIISFLHLKDEYKNLKLVLVGSGEYDNYLSISQGCIGRICFTGRLDKSTLKFFYLFSDIGILSSRYEQCSYTILEMKCYGLPVVITDIPGLNELIIHKETGLISQVKFKSNTEHSLQTDTMDLANQIKLLINNSKMLRQLVKNATNDLYLRFKSSIMAKKTINTYYQSLKKY